MEGSPDVTTGNPTEHWQSSQAYELFVLVLTVLSLVIMAAMLLPFDDSTIGLLQFYDNLICVVFLIDFGFRMYRAPSKRGYFIGERGWLDLLGSIPSLGVAFRYSGLFRLARLSRLARILRVRRNRQHGALARDVLANRSRYAVVITVMSALIVLCAASVLVLQFESRSSDASIATGWDAFWYSIVTITTVGYGDLTPVTVPGRIAAIFIMLAGLGIIGALASILASVLVGGGDEPAPAAGPAGTSEELAAIRAELAEVRAVLARMEDVLRATPGP